jgi:Holliday junction resolvasome RuvABC DNA-binding subunit
VEVQKALRQAHAAAEDADTETLIRQALKILA